MKDFTLQLRCNICDSALAAHWRVDTAGVFAHVDPCHKCNAAQPALAPDVAYWRCKKCGDFCYKDFDICGTCQTPRG